MHIGLPQADVTPIFPDVFDVPAPAAPTGDAPLRWSFEEVAGLLSNADNREELAGVVLDYAVQHMPGAVLFGVRDTSAYVWGWRGLNLAPARVSGLEFSVAKSTVFQLLGGESHYQGPVPSLPEHHEFFERLDRPLPAEILLLPIHLNDRLIAVLYGEGNDARLITADIEDYLQLVSKISMALNIIILKTKIRVG